MAPIASAATPPADWRVTAKRSAKICSCAIGDWPTTREESNSITVPTPGAASPSSNSLQPMIPSSVDSLTKLKFRQPASQ
jgi:hypothetical protein